MVGRFASFLALPLAAACAPVTGGGDAPSLPPAAVADGALLVAGRGKSLPDPGLRDTLKPDFYLAEEDHLREKGMFWED